MVVRCVHLDFETRSKVDLKKHGVWNYASDPSTSIICCAYAIDDEKTKLVIGKEYPKFDGYLTDFSELIELAKDPEVIFFAHNATFEMRLWENVLWPVYGVPIVPIERWVCTMALAYMFNLPGSLDKVGEALSLTTTKDRRGKLLISQLCSPNKVTTTRKKDYIEVFWEKYEPLGLYTLVDGIKANGLYWNDDPEKFHEFYDYCITDVVVEHGITKMLPRLVPFERKIWEMDKTMNHEGMQIDLELIEAAEFIFEEHKQRLKPIFKEITGLEPTQVAKVIVWLIENGVPEKKLTKYVFEDGKRIAKRTLDAPTIAKLIEDDEITAIQMQVIKIRKEFSKSSIAKFQAFRNLSDKDGILRDYLIYGRAVTMRWGGNGAQPQNLPSRGCAKNQELLIYLIKNKDYDMLSLCYPDVSQALSSAIRGVIIARAGHNLIVSDYSAIEARVLSWLAGDRVACQEFVAGVDRYVSMAKVIYGDRSITKEKNPVERSVGKQAVLGCGYQMGAPKFKDTCANFGIPVSLELAKKAVSAYRDANPKVKALWKDMNNCAMYSVNHPGQKVYVTSSESKVYYVTQGSYLFLVLPSKRFIAYPFPIVAKVEKTFGEGEEKHTVVMDSLTYMKEDSAQGNKWVRVDTYGGKLAENGVQAIARDIMAIGGMNCNDIGYILKLMVHDEAISEIIKGFGSVKEFEMLLADLPEWADGCPIAAADGWIDERYRK